MDASLESIKGSCWRLVERQARHSGDMQIVPCMHRTSETDHDALVSGSFPVARVVAMVILAARSRDVFAGFRCTGRCDDSHSAQSCVLLSLLGNGYAMSSRPGEII